MSDTTTARRFPTITDESLGALRALLGRFIAAGASKFVVIPLARDLLGWLREMYAEAIAPVERSGS